MTCVSFVRESNKKGYTVLSNILDELEMKKNTINIYVYKLNDICDK